MLRLAGGDPVAAAEVARLLQITRHRRPLPAADAVRHHLDARQAPASSTTLAVYLERWLAVRPVDENTRPGVTARAGAARGW
ncbi:hypothetical protein [Phytohabitans suffuscus]|uniref:hypothetical protein n=1 Tax=Phytohabitans suffuscus TaxID=624315 RepID=UPI001567BB80|nr:hypothetical protein [Phytohabitans suffuscus]